MLSAGKYTPFRVTWPDSHPFIDNSRRETLRAVKKGFPSLVPEVFT